MTTVVVGAAPPELDVLIERHRDAGADRLDEVWEGVLHIVPAPSDGHADVARQFAQLLAPLAHPSLGHAEVLLGEPRMKNSCIVETDLPLGIAQFITNLGRHVADSAEVVWFGDPSLAPRQLPAMRADRLPYPALDLVGRQLARRAGVDVMHFTANTGWTCGGSPPFVLTVHDLHFMDTPISSRSMRQVLGHRYARRNVTHAMRAASAVATPSAASAAEVTNRVQLGQAVVVIPNGVDPGSTAPTRAGGTSYAVAFAARDPRKGVDVAVAGWRAAMNRPEQLWLLAGAGLPPGLEDDIAPELASGQISILPYLERDRLAAILAGASALIYPSSAEGFGLPVLEAMALGVPVLSGLTPSTRELGGEAIIQLAANDPVASIADALRLIATDPAAVRALVTAGRRRAERYTWSECARAYLEVYRAVWGA